MLLIFQTPELTAEEQEQRLKKAEAIRKMLSETTVTAPEGGGTHFSLFLKSLNCLMFSVYDNNYKNIFTIIINMHVVSDDDSNVEKSDTLKRKVVEEKRQRDHILQLNQILAKQVMEKSKMVAGTCNNNISNDFCMICNRLYVTAMAACSFLFSFQKMKKRYFFITFNAMISFRYCCTIYISLLLTKAMFKRCSIPFIQFERIYINSFI